MHWLAKVNSLPSFDNISQGGLIIVVEQQPSWGRSREFEITTRSVNRSGLQSTGDLEDEEDEEEDRLNHGRTKRTVAFMPSIGE